MKKPFTVYIQARKWSCSDKFEIELNTVEHKTSEYSLYVTLGQQDFEINMPEINDEKLTLAHIDYLRGLKNHVNAEAQQKLASLDTQINELLALENKEVA